MALFPVSTAVFLVLFIPVMMPIRSLRRVKPWRGSARPIPTQQKRMQPDFQGKHIRAGKIWCPFAIDGLFCWWVFGGCCCFFSPRFILGRDDPIWQHMFEMGWKHQLVIIDVLKALMAIPKRWKTRLVGFETGALPPGFFRVSLSQMQRLCKRKRDQ